MVSVTANGRCRRGTYSEARDAAFGMAPPRPTPARNRSALSMKTESIKATRNVRTAKVITLKSRAVRRPNLSPMTPPSRPPISIPAGPHASAERSCALAAGTWHIGEPLGGDVRDGVRQDLVVDAVKDDRQRRPEDQQLLIAGPSPCVDGRTDVNGLHATGPLEGSREFGRSERLERFERFDDSNVRTIQGREYISEAVV